MVKPLTFKGDKRPRKRKHGSSTATTEPTVSASSTTTSASVSTSAPSDSDWVLGTTPAELAGPVMFVFAPENSGESADKETDPETEKVSATAQRQSQPQLKTLAAESDGTVFASVLESAPLVQTDSDPDLEVTQPQTKMATNVAATAEPSDIRQVWLLSSVPGDAAETRKRRRADADIIRSVNNTASGSADAAQSGTEHRDKDRNENRDDAAEVDDEYASRAVILKSPAAGGRFLSCDPATGALRADTMAVSVPATVFYIRMPRVLGGKGRKFGDDEGKMVLEAAATGGCVGLATSVAGAVSGSGSSATTSAGAATAAYGQVRAPRPQSRPHTDTDSGTDTAEQADDDASDGAVTLFVRMQARFKQQQQAALTPGAPPSTPAVPSSNSSSTTPAGATTLATDRIGRRTLQEMAGRRLEDSEVRMLRRAHRDGEFHEALLDVRVRGRHDKFAAF